MKPILCCAIGLSTLVVSLGAASVPENADKIPDADPVSAAPNTIMPSFDAVDGYLAEFKAMYETRSQMLDVYFTLQEDSVERETMRIQLRKMTGQMKRLVETINLMLANMATLRDKKQEIKKEETR